MMPKLWRVKETVVLTGRENANKIIYIKIKKRIAIISVVVYYLRVFRPVAGTDPLKRIYIL